MEVEKLADEEKRGSGERSRVGLSSSSELGKSERCKFSRHRDEVGPGASEEEAVCRSDGCGRSRKRRNRGEEEADAVVQGVTDLSPPITVQSVMFDAAVVFYAATSKRCASPPIRSTDLIFPWTAVAVAASQPSTPLDPRVTVFFVFSSFIHPVFATISSIRLLWHRASPG